MKKWLDDSIFSQHSVLNTQHPTPNTQHPVRGKRVLAALSGGVDSAVAAALLALHRLWDVWYGRAPARKDTRLNEPTA